MFESFPLLLINKKFAIHFGEETANEKTKEH